MHGHLAGNDAVLCQRLPELRHRLLEQLAAVLGLRPDVERQMPPVEHGIDVHRAKLRGFDLERDLLAADPD